SKSRGMATPVTLIPGDGIGPEMVNAAVEEIEAVGARLQWERAAAGDSAVPTHGMPIPAQPHESIRRTKLALKGPLATPVGEGFRSVIVAAGSRLQWERADAGASAVPTHGTPIPAQTLESIRRTKLELKRPLATPVGERFRSVYVALRNEFDLYANVRPARSFAGVETRYTGVDLVVIRENTQGLYSGVEHYIDDERTAAESISIITRKGSERIIEFAFEFVK